MTKSSTTLLKRSANRKFIMLSKLRYIATKLVRKMVRKFNGVLLSQNGYDSLLNQRNAAVKILISERKSSLSTGVTGVVFSKDRPIQLHALIKTYFENVHAPAPLYVIFNTSSLAYAEAYRELALEVKNDAVIFVPESGTFKTTLIKVLHLIKTNNIFFLVDDIVFIRQVDFSILSQLSPFEEILSLRHSPHLRRSYTANVDQLPPAIRPSISHRDLLEFNWSEQGNEWSDPWSVDGHVLSTDEVLVISAISDFNAPNTFESVLKSFSQLTKGRKGLCYHESKILNLPVNRVQDEIANRNGNVSATFLLNSWADGMMLDTTMFAKVIPASTHEEHVLKFIKREAINFKSTH